MAIDKIIQELLEGQEIRFSYDQKEYVLKLTVPPGSDINLPATYYNKSFQLSITEAENQGDTVRQVLFSPIASAHYLDPNTLMSRIDRFYVEPNDNGLNYQNILMQITLVLSKELMGRLQFATNQYIKTDRIHLPKADVNLDFYRQFGEIVNEKNETYLNPRGDIHMDITELAAPAAKILVENHRIFSLVRSYE